MYDTNKVKIDHKSGSRIFGRFKVHPDKILLRIWPVKGFDEKLGIWIPPSVVKREMSFRFARILQVGERLEQYYPGLFKIGEIVLVNKNVDQVYGREGKFKLGGKYVCVTMSTEILCAVDDDEKHDIPDYVLKGGIKHE